MDPDELLAIVEGYEIRRLIVGEPDLILSCIQCGQVVDDVDSCSTLAGLVRTAMNHVCVAR